MWPCRLRTGTNYHLVWCFLSGSWLPAWYPFEEVPQIVFFHFPMKVPFTTWEVLSQRTNSLASSCMKIRREILTFRRCTEKLNIVGTTFSLSLVIWPVLSKHFSSKCWEQRTEFLEGFHASRFMLITHCSRRDIVLNGKLKSTWNTLIKSMSSDFFQKGWRNNNHS